MEFDRYTIVLLLRNPQAPKLDAAAEDALQDAHLDHLATMHEAGHVLAAGPLVGSDDRTIRGLTILNLPPERARSLSEEDPAVRAGRFTLEILPWLVPHGTMSFHASRFPHSSAEAERG